MGVTVINTPLAVTGSTTVSGTIAATQSGTWNVNALVSNAPVRYHPIVCCSVGGTTVIPPDAVPTGKTLIISYANVLGGSNVSGFPITKVACHMILLTNNGTSKAPFAGLHTHIDNTPTEAVVSASEAMYLPLSTGEGMAVDCVSDISGSFFVTLSGYFTSSN